MFCRRCGKQINETANFCPYCGDKQIYTNFSEFVTNTHTFQAPRIQSYFIPHSRYDSLYFQKLVDTVSQRIKTNAVIWIVLATLQILFGLSGNIPIIVIGLLNLTSAVRDIRVSKKFTQKPVGIVNEVKPLVGSVINIIFNFFIGGFFGVIGTIYYLVAIRGYVLENEQAFLELEKAFNSKCMPSQQRQS